ncbi:MAG TPA: biopolymer transporter ExbD [Chthoniobacter sp.]|nr:biopolymer transporter ExbD [Chthoniobacter sp.]
MSHRASHAKTQRAQTRLPPEEDPEFQIAPMIDILLVLLVFFMSISSTEVLQVNKEVTLPVAKDAKEADKDSKGQTIVNVMWATLNNAGSLEVDNQKFAQPDQMIGYLQTKTQNNPEMRILIRADRNVRYDYLKQVMITAGKAGVGKVTFSVVNKDASAPE